LVLGMVVGRRRRRTRGSTSSGAGTSRQLQRITDRDDCDKRVERWARKQMLAAFSKVLLRCVQRIRNWLSHRVTYWNHNAMNIPFKCLRKMITEDEMKKKRKKEHTPEKWAMGGFIYQSPAHRCFKNSRNTPSLRGPFGGFKPVRVPIPKPFPMGTSYSCRCSRDVGGSCMHPPSSGVVSQCGRPENTNPATATFSGPELDCSGQSFYDFIIGFLNFFVSLCQRGPDMRKSASYTTVTREQSYRQNQQQQLLTMRPIDRSISPSRRSTFHSSGSTLLKHFQVQTCNSIDQERS
jgi:hypothetical protein